MGAGCKNTRGPADPRVRGVSYLLCLLCDEVRIYISGYAGLRYEYPYVECLAAAEGGYLYVSAGDLYCIAVIELSALDLVLILCFRSGADCQIS